MVATSGDTGGAVAQAFYGIPEIEVIILYPYEKISARQEAQLCCWGENIKALAVQGSFDDCQKLVKETLLDPHSKRNFISANSINLGRILPQMIYYAFHALQFFRTHGEPLHFIIPSGNLGNSLACIWAKKMGLPIGNLILAFNANRTIPEWLKSGQYLPLPTQATLANAMDVGNPSNQERLKNLFPLIDDLRLQIRAESVSDEEIKNEIKTSVLQWGQALCPHTATAAVIRKRLPDSEDRLPWALVATAHPAKFESIVEPLIGQELEVPPELAKLLALPIQRAIIPADFSELKKILDRSST